MFEGMSHCWGVMGTGGGWCGLSRAGLLVFLLYSWLDQEAEPVHFLEMRQLRLREGKQLPSREWWYRL